MKDLLIRKISFNGNAEPGMASHLLEKYAVNHRIDTINWRDFPYKPKVSFRIGYHEDEIWLKYYVRERHILAQETRINGDVYKDSCVEFFILTDKVNYYNFEFNCIGTAHVGYGAGRKNRIFVDPEQIRMIKIVSSLGKEPFEQKTGDFEWELSVIIPKACFQFDKQIHLSGLKAYGNFYKCGDATSEPHFVTWNPVATENPDYHRPEFFGILNFEA